MEEQQFIRNVCTNELVFGCVFHLVPVRFSISPEFIHDTDYITDGVGYSRQLSSSFSFTLTTAFNN